MNEAVAIDSSSELAMAEQPTHDVFICYAREDEAWARDRATVLRAGGLDVFMDIQSVRPGDPWRQRIDEGVRRARRFFLGWSRHAAASKEVEREWREALHLRAHRSDQFINLERLDATPLPEELASTQACDGGSRTRVGLEIVLDKQFEQFREHDAEVLRMALAGLLGVSPSSIKILSKKPGSVRLGLEFDEKAAQALQRMAKRRDPLFEKVAATLQLQSVRPLSLSSDAQAGIHAIGEQRVRRINRRNANRRKANLVAGSDIAGGGPTDLSDNGRITLQEIFERVAVVEPGIIRFYQIGLVIPEALAVFGEQIQHQSMGFDKFVLIIDFTDATIPDLNYGEVIVEWSKTHACAHRCFVMPGVTARPIMRLMSRAGANVTVHASLDKAIECAREVLSKNNATHAPSNWLTWRSRADIVATQASRVPKQVWSWLQAAVSGMVLRPMVPALNNELPQEGATLFGKPAAHAPSFRLFVVDEEHPNGYEVTAHFRINDGDLWSLDPGEQVLIVLFASRQPLPETAELKELFELATAHDDIGVQAQLFSLPS